MERAFLKVANNLLVKKNNYVAEYEALFSPLFANTDALKSRLEMLQIEYSDILDQAEKLVHDNAIKSKDQEKYQADFNAMDAMIKAKAGEIETLEKEIADSGVRKENISIFLNALEGTDTLLTKFDSALWNRLVDYVTITPEGKLFFKLRNGQEMIVLLEEVH